MDKETLSQYSWLIITAIVLVLMIGIAIPFADDIAAAIKGIPDEIVNSDEVDTTPHEHVYVNQVSKSRYLASEASCISPARYYLSCTCGEAGTETFEYGFTNANAHVGEQEKEYAPIDAVEHSKKTICSSCNAVITNITEEHVLGENICTLCGYGDAHEHDYSVELADEAFIVSAATCTTPAIYYRSCSCGEVGTETFSFGEALGHNYTSSVTKAATCTETGVRTYTCENDASHTYTEEIAKVAHTEGTRNEVTAPTCTEKGYTTYITYCTVCGEEISRTVSDYTDSLGHNYTSAVTKEATCTEAGVLTYTCSCGDSYTEEIPEKAHTPGAEATCETAQICTMCGKELAAALGHDYEEIKSYTEPTCTTDGEFEYRYICSVCGDEDLEAYWTETDIDSALGHDYTSAVTKEATCTETGILTYTCEACGDAYTEDIDALGHKDTNTDHVCDNGCGIYQGTHEDGADADHLCDYGCKKIADEGCYDTVVDGKCDECGENIVHDCTDASNDGDHKCDICGEDNISSHDWNDATCTTPETCSECGQTDGEALGHNYADGEYESDENVHWQICTVCGTTSDTEEHDWVAEDVYIDPTCTEDGYWNHQEACEKCGYLNEWQDYDAGTALGHNYTSAVTKEATCTEAGVITYTCSCGDSYTEDIAALGHTLATNSYTYVDMSNHTVDQICTVCGYENSNTVIHLSDANGNCYVCKGHCKHIYNQEIVSEKTQCAPATCCYPARYYYSCSCGAMEYNLNNLFVYGEVDSSNHGQWAGYIMTQTYKIYVYETETSHRMHTHCAYCDAETSYSFLYPHSDDGTGACPDCGGCLHSFVLEQAEDEYLKTAATCTSAAEYYYSCKCGEKGTTTFTYGTATGHTYNKQIITSDYLKSEATCTSAAVYYYSCECGAKGTATFTAGSAPGHTYNQKVTTSTYLKSNATCTSAAVYYYSCSCGAKGTTTFTSGSALGHTYNQKVTTSTYRKSAATCTSAAVYYYSCSCGAKGSTTFTSGSAPGHTYNRQVTSSTYRKSAATCTSAAVYYYSCSCGAKGTTTFTSGSALGHTYNQKVTTATYLKSEATCTSAAVYYYSCSCGAKGTTTFTSGSALGHTALNYAYECTRCGEYFPGLYATGTTKQIYSWSELVSAGIISSAGKVIAGQEYKLAGDLAVSSTITEISAGALTNCTNLTGLCIPSSVYEINSNALTGTEDITTLIIPDMSLYYDYFDCYKVTGFGQSTTISSLTKLIVTGATQGTTWVGKEAFLGCENLTNVTIIEGITSIMEGAFGSTPIKTINLPDGVLSIGAYAFMSCEELPSIILPETVTTIGTAAFAYCFSLEEIYIPAAVTEISGMAFRGCTNLSNISFGGTKAQWKAMSLASNWNYGCGAITVTCTDGTITIAANN